MENVTEIKRLIPLPPDSPFMKPRRFFYIQNGKSKFWDLLKIRDQVSIVIFNKSTNKLVFVRQFRPAIYYSIITSSGCPIESADLNQFRPSLAITVELCGGMVDKNMSIKDIAREEISEECGFDIPINRLEEIYQFKTAVSPASSTHTLYYCEVCESDRLPKTNCQSIIETVEYSIQEVKNMLSKCADINSPPVFILGVMWFLSQMKSKNTQCSSTCKPQI